MSDTVLLADVRSVGVATVQDGGRRGLAHLGVPLSGALHRERYAAAGLLLRGAPDPGLPSIELLAGRLVLTVHAPTQIAVVGPARVTVDERHAAAGVVLGTEPGSQVAVEVTPGAGAAYVVVDGWRAERVLGSAATDTFGGLGGAPLTAGYALVGRPPVERARVGWFCRLPATPSGPIRYVPSTAGEALVGSWQVAAASRSGIRLAATAGTGAQGADRAGAVSHPVVPGTVQLTPGGEAIVLGPDGGVTGGYLVAGVVASVDLDRVATIAAGAMVRFAAIDVTSAHAAALARREALRRCLGHADLAR